MTDKKDKFDPSQLSGAGMDTLEDQQKMPLLRIIQTNSPEVKKSHAQYATKHIEGAEEGMIVFTPEGLLFTEVEILPLAQKSLYAEWRNKKDGGGFIQHHPATITQHPDYRKGSEKSQWDEFLGENELIWTMYWMLLFLHEGEWKKGMVALKKTELKHGRALQDMVKRFTYPEEKKYEGVRPATFSRSYTLTTKSESNDEGDWYNWSVEPLRVLDFTKDADVLQTALEAQRDAIESLPVAEKPKQLETASSNADETPF